MKIYRLGQNSSKEAIVPLLSQARMPVPKGTEVRVSIRSASLNYRDLIVATKENIGSIPLSDAAGIVDAIGPDASHWRPGDQVVLPFFPRWIDGAFDTDHLATARGGGAVEGVLGDYIVAEEQSLVRAPDHLSLEEAACLPCAGVTAWHALTRCGFSSSQSLVVMGTGGVALFGLQFGVALGAKVIVLSSSETKLQEARKLGASMTINYRQQPDWDQAVRDATDGRGADCILELGGRDTYERSLRALAAGGKIAQIGVLAGFNASPNLMRLQSVNADIVGITVGSSAHFRAMNDFLTAHAMHPIVDRIFDFEDVADAYDRMRAGLHFGKIALRRTG